MTVLIRTMHFQCAAHCVLTLFTHHSFSQTLSTSSPRWQNPHCILLSFQFTFSLHSVTDIALKHGEQFGTTFSFLLTDTVRQTILMLDTQKLLKWDHVSDWSLMLFHSVLSRPSYDPRLASTPNLRSSILFNLLTGNCQHKTGDFNDSCSFDLW